VEQKRQKLSAARRGHLRESRPRVGAATLLPRLAQSIASRIPGTTTCHNCQPYHVPLANETTATIITIKIHLLPLYFNIQHSSVGDELAQRVKASKGAPARTDRLCTLYLVVCTLLCARRRGIDAVHTQNDLLPSALRARWVVLRSDCGFHVSQ